MNPNAEQINVAAQEDDEHSVLAHYRRLIRLRHELPVIADGAFERFDAGDDAIFAFERVLEDERLLVVTNLSSASRVPAFAPAKIARWHSALPILENLGSNGAPDERLRPWEARVYHS